MNTVELSKMVRKARKAQGLSQKDVSDLAGVGMTVVYKIEAGRGDVTLSSFVAVLSALGVDVHCRSPLGGEVSLGG